MRITIEGPAAAADAKDAEILDVDRLRAFDGVKSEATCVDYLDDSLAEIGLVGGHVEFVFDEPSGRLRVRTVYHSPRKLKKKELDQLAEETRGQWSDGIGEGDLSGDPDVHLLAYPMLSASVDVDEFTIEQIDDGVKVKRPRKSPLFNAVKKDDVAKIAKLLDAGEPIDARDRDRNTPLIACVWMKENHEAAALLLIERGAALDVFNKHHSTPLKLAAMFGRTPIVKALLDAGADPYFVDPDDYTEHYPLHMACNRRQADEVRLLVEHGADVNIACSSGYTPIMHVHRDDVEIARFLVEHGADVDAKNKLGGRMDAKLKAAIG